MLETECRQAWEYKILEGIGFRGLDTYWGFIQRASEVLTVRFQTCLLLLYCEISRVSLHNKVLLSRENASAWVHFWNLIPFGEMKLLPTPVTFILLFQLQGENMVLMEQDFNQGSRVGNYSQVARIEDKPVYLEEGKKHNPKKDWYLINHKDWYLIIGL